MQVSSRVQIYPSAVGSLTANQKKALELTAEALLTEVRTAQKNAVLYRNVAER